MFKHLLFISMLLATFSCATSKKQMEVEKLSFITFDLRTYDVIRSKTGWVACEASYLKANDNKTLENLWETGLNPQETEVCSMYKCDDKACVDKGDYLAFSKVVNYLLEQDRRTQYKTSSSSRDIYDIDKSKNSCFQGGNVNSCAILSAMYRHMIFNRKEFFKVRTRECELLGISQKNCSFDL